MQASRSTGDLLLLGIGPAANRCAGTDRNPETREGSDSVCLHGAVTGLFRNVSCECDPEFAPILTLMPVSTFEQRLPIHLQDEAEEKKRETIHNPLINVGLIEHVAKKLRWTAGRRLPIPERAGSTRIVDMRLFATIAW